MSSYVNTCILRGVITSRPRRSEKGVWNFDFEVQLAGAERGARADSGCKSYDKRIKVALWVKDKGLALKKGQVLWLRDRHDHEEDAPPSHDFFLLNEATGKESMDPDK